MPAGGEYGLGLGHLKSPLSTTSIPLNRGGRRVIRINRGDVKNMKKRRVGG